MFELRRAVFRTGASSKCASGGINQSSGLAREASGKQSLLCNLALYFAGHASAMQAWTTTYAAAPQRCIGGIIPQPRHGHIGV